MTLVGRTLPLSTPLLTPASTDRERPRATTRAWSSDDRERPAPDVHREDRRGRTRTARSRGAGRDGTQGRSPNSRGRRARDRGGPRKRDRPDAGWQARAGYGRIAGHL